jgi:hypothetical protein
VVVGLVVLFAVIGYKCVVGRHGRGAASSDRLAAGDAVHFPSEPVTVVVLGGRDKEVALPFRTVPISSYPMLTVSSGGSAGSFVFDTGGGPDGLVSDEFRRTIAAPVAANAVSTIRGKRYRIAVIPELQIGGPDCLVVNAKASVTSLRDMSRICGNEAVDGLLPSCVFRDYEVDIDYPNGVLRLRPSHSPANPPESFPLPMPRHLEAPDSVGVVGPPSDEDKPYAILELGRISLPVLVDTCSPGALTISDHWLKASGARLQDATETLGAHGFGRSPMSVRRGVIEEVKLGPIVIRGIHACVYPDAMIGRQPSAPRS